MTTQTLPYGVTKTHTEATLKARHQEALDIFEAWCDRCRVAGGSDLAAAELQRDEAWDWVVRTKQDLDLYRSVACRRAPVAGVSYFRGRGGVIGHG